MLKQIQIPVIPVILSGGMGSRLWPLSREWRPKPYIKLADGQSLIQKTYLRALSATQSNEIVTVMNRDLFFTTKDEYEAVSKKECRHTFILEPISRNSCPAILLAAYHLEKEYGTNAIMLILPADHLVQNNERFIDCAQKAIDIANEGNFVTFGIKPTSPKTGYGYMRADGPIVKQFIEKPNLEIAETYFKSGDYYWNSGIFCTKVDTLLKKARIHCPEITEKTNQCILSSKKYEGDHLTQIEISYPLFSSIENISIDYALLEKLHDMTLVPCDMGWSDIGCWLEFGNLQPQEGENRIMGETVLSDVKNCTIYSQHRLIAALGIEDLIIADTEDALLVAHKNHTQNVRDIVEKLKSRDDARYKTFPKSAQSEGIKNRNEETPLHFNQTKILQE